MIGCCLHFPLAFPLSHLVSPLLLSCFIPLCVGGALLRKRQRLESAAGGSLQELPGAGQRAWPRGRCLPCHQVRPQDRSRVWAPLLLLFLLGRARSRILSLVHQESTGMLISNACPASFPVLRINEMATASKITNPPPHPAPGAAFCAAPPAADSAFPAAAAAV